MKPLIPKNQRGIALLEMALVSAILLTVIFGSIEMARLFWTVNALTDATRRGARYAVVNAANVDEVKNVVAYGTTTAGTHTIVSGLNPATNVSVVYSDDFGLAQGEVTVSITDFTFAFAVPIVGPNITLPAFTTTLTAESAGVAPPSGPAPTPTPGPSPSPTVTPSPSPNPTPTPSPSATPTPAPSATPTPGPSPTPTPCICFNPGGQCKPCRN